MAETVKLFLNGEWVASEATETVPVYNPSGGTIPSSAIYTYRAPKAYRSSRDKK